MRFDTFLTALERDIAQTKVVTLEKGTDVNARPVINIRNQRGDIIIELLYSENSLGKASRAVRLLNPDGTKHTACSSGEAMAMHMVLYLRKYIQLPNAAKELSNKGVFV